METPKGIDSGGNYAESKIEDALDCLVKNYPEVIEYPEMLGAALEDAEQCIENTENVMRDFKIAPMDINAVNNALDAVDACMRQIEIQAFFISELNNKLDERRADLGCRAALKKFLEHFIEIPEKIINDSKTILNYLE